MINVCFAILLMSITMSCSVNDSAKMTSFQNENAAVHNQNLSILDKSLPVNAENSKTAVVKDENSKTLDCNDPNGYSLSVIEDTSRDVKNTVTTPKLLNIIVGDEVITTIKIPTQSDANGFSLNWAKKTKKGFEVSIEYGSRYYFKKQFSFICKEDNFYFYKVKIESFDKNDPESMDNWDEKETQIKPNLPIEKFSILDYLRNE